MIRSTIFNLVFYAFTFFVAMMAWFIAKLSSRRVLWRWLNFWGRATVWLLRVIMGARVEVRGIEHITPDRPQIIVCKHQSELDIVMIGALMNDISAVAMAELTRLPFFGAILKKLDVITVAVDSGRQGRTQQAIDGALRMKQEGRSMVIYPEGELMKLGAKERYRQGAGHIYHAMQVDAVPVAVSLGVIWPQRRWRKYPGTTGVIEFMEPIAPGLDVADFMAVVEDRIETHTMVLIEECATGAILEAARARKARGATNAD